MRRSALITAGVVLSLIVLAGAAFALASAGDDGDPVVGEAPIASTPTGVTPTATATLPAQIDPAPAATSTVIAPPPTSTSALPPPAATRVPPSTSPDTPVSSPPLAPSDPRGGPPSVPALPPSTPPSSLPPGTVLEPAPIDGLDLVVRESFPPQYGLQIKAGLPGGCARPAGQEMTRSGNVIRVRVLNTNTPGAICTAIYGMYEVNLNLGSDFVSGQEYRVEVNDKVLTFKAQ